MPFKRSIEIFGDDGANGPRVPVSETNPPGTSAGNRGIQFGEPVLAEVQNRPVYALALNTDDLHDRLLIFEQQGLNAAYRAGITDDPEEGRHVTLDGGAIETHTDRGESAVDGTGAHYRANMSDDNVSTSVGFEAKGPGAGLLHVTPYITNNHSVLPASFEGVLNPAGAGSFVLSTPTPGVTFADVDGYTDLIAGLDLVYVTVGDVTTAWIFVSTIDEFTLTMAAIHALGSPTYAANTACTVSIYRVRHGGFTPASRVQGAQAANSAFMVGAPGSPAVLSLIPGGPEDSVSALRVFETSLLGQLRETMAFENAELRFTKTNAEGLTTGYRRYRQTGAPSILFDVRSRTGTASFTGDGGIQSLMFGRFRGLTPVLTSLMTAEVSTLFSGDAALADGFAADFQAASANIVLAITPTTGLGVLRSLLGGDAVLECLTSSNPDYVGHYWLRSTSGDATYELRYLSGETPIFSAATGTWRVRMLLETGGNVTVPVDATLPDGNTLSSQDSYRFRGGVQGTSFGILEAAGTGPYYKQFRFVANAAGLQHRGGFWFGDDGVIDGDLAAVDGVFTGEVQGTRHHLVSTADPLLQPTKRIQIPIELGCPEDADDLFLADGTALTVNTATSGAFIVTVTGTLPEWLTIGDRLRISHASDVEHIISSIAGANIGIRPELPATFSAGTEIVVRKMQSSKTWRYLDSPNNHTENYRGWYAYHPKGIIRFPIVLPAQVRLTAARVLVWTHARTDDVNAGGVRHLVAGVARRAVIDFAGPTAPSYTSVGATASPADASSGLQTMELVTGTVTMDSAHSYYLYVQAGSDGQGSPNEYDNPARLLNLYTDIILGAEIDVEVIDAIHTSNQSAY